LNYIHNNPIRADWVGMAQHYIYSRVCPDNGTPNKNRVNEEISP
jgi:hypothetical protein